MGDVEKESAFDTLFRTHNHGRIQIWALDQKYNDYAGNVATFMDLADHMIAEREKYIDVEVENVLYKMIIKDYKNILTPKQIEYIETVDEEGKYRRNDKYYYRNVIQNNLMNHFFGQPIKYSRSLNHYLAIIKYANDLIAVREDPTAFISTINKLSDTFYLENILYDKLNPTMCKEVILASKALNPLSAFTINTICEIAEDDIALYTKKIYE